MEEILTLVAEEAIAEEIAEEIVAEEVAEEIVAEEVAEEIAEEIVAEELAEEVIEEDVANIMAIIDNVVTEEEAEEKIIAIIDTLPATTPVSTSAQPQENIIRFHHTNDHNSHNPLLQGHHQPGDHRGGETDPTEDYDSTRRHCCLQVCLLIRIIMIRIMLMRFMTQQDGKTG